MKIPFITGSKKETVFLLCVFLPGKGTLTCVIISSLTQQLSHLDSGMVSLSCIPTHQLFRVLQSTSGLCSTSYRFIFQPCQPHVNLYTLMSSISIQTGLKCNVFYSSGRLLMTFLLGKGTEINLLQHFLVQITPAFTKSVAWQRFISWVSNTSLWVTAGKQAVHKRCCKSILDCFPLT